MHARDAVVLGLLLLASGCATKVVRVDMDATRLAPASPREIPRLACPHRLGDVVDARPGDGESGGLGRHAFKFSNAAETIRGQLLGAGMTDAAMDTGTSPAVNIRLVQLYLTQNQITKIPVAVYQVSVDGAPEFVVRSQKATMNWNGSEDEAYAAYARVLADVNQQLVRQINARCNQG
jgi:hypothetical protein